MPDKRDYNFRRPPRRKTWEEDGDQNEVDDNGFGQNSSDKAGRGSNNINDAEEAGTKEGTYRSGKRVSRGIQPGSLDQKDGKGKEVRSLGSAWGGDKTTQDDDEKKARSKYNQKRLYKMLGSQAFCLAVIFGMISAFNWMATDYSGDYMGQNPQLGMVRLSLTRRATTVDAELSYGRPSNFLELDQSKDQPTPRADKPISLYFATPEQWRRPDKQVGYANFNGRIEDGTAAGTISDSSGQYKIKLEKNVLTSLFAQLQSHIPKIPAVPLPSLFDETKAQRVSSPK